MSNFKLETCQREDMIEFLKDKKVTLIHNPFPSDDTWKTIKSPNTEEAIEYAPFWISLFKDPWWYYKISRSECAEHKFEIYHKDDIKWNTPIEALENMYIYLLDNKKLK